jgi:hypothetical protein
MDVDPVTGTVYVAFYDRRDHSDNLTTDVFYAHSQDGGDHFTNEKVSATAFIPNSNVFFGDYIGISAFAGRVRPFWMRLDGNTLSVWTALIERPSADVGGGSISHHGIEVIPNPVHGAGVTIVFQEPRGGPVRVIIHDAGGRVVRTLDEMTGSDVVWDGRNDLGEQVPAGVYFAREDRSKSARIVLIR